MVVAGTGAVLLFPPPCHDNPNVLGGALHTPSNIRCWKWRPSKIRLQNPFLNGSPLPSSIEFSSKYTDGFFQRKCIWAWSSARAVYSENVSATPETSRGVSASRSSEVDSITSLNQRLRKEHRRNRAPKEAINPEEAQEYIRLVKEQQRRGFQKLKQGEFRGSYAVDPNTLVPGDYVVHKKVGVGRFIGMKYDKRDEYSSMLKYVYIEYADGMAKLPAKQAHRLLYRYNLPNEMRKPRSLSKLSDTSVWEKRKNKGKITIQKMVGDLMELYLQRLKQKRPPYPKSPAMIEFAAKFPYVPTPDQQQAFVDVESDLTERDTPMDRLICGDVGFGKTEVALRAIFCVVSAGKQAMVLAPTVVLAKQHYDVICERYSYYPDIKVALLTRFQTKAEKDELFARIRQGLLNVIVGTHSLLGNGVVYNNLGLLVVDEEQKGHLLLPTF